MILNITLPILFFIVFFSILNHDVSVESAVFISSTFIKLNRILNFLFGIAVVINVISVLLNKHNIYGFIGFANLLVFLNTNKALDSTFVDKNQANGIFFILFSVYVIGLLAIFSTKAILKGGFIK